MISAVLLATAIAQPQPKAPALTIKPARVLQGVRPVAFTASPKASTFAASMEDATIRIIDAKTYKTLKTLEGHPVPAYAMAWSKDGAFLATGDESARIFIWDTRTWKKVREMRKHIRGIQSLDWNFPRTRLVSTGKDDVVKVWDPTAGKELQTILGNGANFFSATYIGKTNDFGVGILGQGARIYDSAGKIKNFLTGHEGQGVLDIDFNPAGTRAATASKDARGAIWDPKKYRRLNYLKGHSDWVLYCRFSQNGKWVATGSSDRTVKVWNIHSYQPVITLEDQSSIGSPLCWTADGKYLVTVNFDGFLQVNSVTPPQPVAAN